MILSAGINPITIYPDARRAAPVEIVLRAPVNEVAPEIMGTLKVGETLEATQGSWLSGGATITGYTYRWFADEDTIEDAEDSTLVLTEELAGATLKVAVIATNSVGSTYIESDTTGQVVPADSAPVNSALPTIAGIARSGELLAASSNGEWTGNGDELLDYDYQWLSDDIVMAGKTGTTLLLTDSEIGERISLRVTATNSIGSTVVESIKTASVVAAQFHPGIVTRPAISGTPREDFTLSVSDGTWNNGNSAITSYTYQWYADGVEIDGATGDTYVAVAEDVGAVLTATVTATNGVGSTTAATQPTAAVLAAVLAPTNTGTPVVSGVTKQGSTLSVTTGEWDDGGSEITGYTYQWKKNTSVNNGVIADATESTYVLTSADLNFYLSCEVTATNEIGSTTKRSTQSTLVTLPPAVTPVGRPVVSGDANVGSTLTTTNGTWDDGGSAIIEYTYAWRADYVVIPGATANTLLLTEGLVGKKIESRVTARNLGGSGTIHSVQTAAVLPILHAPINATLPVITGLAKGGETLSTTNGTWTTNGAAVTGYTYQWNADGAAISGATESTYVITEDEVGTVITVTVTATNSVGSTGATSAGTAEVVTGITIPTNISLPSIDNLAPDADDLLTVTPGEWDQGGSEITETTYQWKADGEDIVGGTGTTLQLTEDQLGMVITVTESVTNNTGTATATSEPTAAVETTLVLSEETIAYLAAMDVQPDNDRKAAINTLVEALKTAGVWSKFDIIGLHAAHDRQAARINLRNPSHEVAENGTLSWTTDRGFQRTGSTASGDNKLNWGARTSWGSTNFAQTSGLTGVCSRTAAMAAGRVFGFGTGQHYATAATATVWDWRAMSGAQSNAHSIGTGHNVLWAINRTTNLAACFFKEKTKTQNLTNYAAGQNPGGDFTIFQHGGATADYNNFECSASFVASGLSDTEWNAFVDAMRAYLTAVGA